MNIITNITSGGNVGKIGVSNAERTALINELDRLRADLILQQEEHKLETKKMEEEIHDLRGQVMTLLRAQNETLLRPLSMEQKTSPSEMFSSNLNSTSGLNRLFSHCTITTSCSRS